MCRHVEEWWDANGLTLTDVDHRRLPEVIVAGNVVGLLSGGRWFRIEPDGKEAKKVAEAAGTDAQIVMGFWDKIEHRFGWLLIHLLHTIAHRQFDHNIAPECTPYLPFDGYISELGELSVFAKTAS